MKWVLRILASLAALLVACVLLLFLFSMKEDSHHSISSVTIHRPPADVWPYLIEEDKLKSWVTWLKAVQRDPGYPAAGASTTWIMEDMNNGGAQMKIHATAKKVDINHVLAVQLSTPGMFHGEAQYTLTDIGNGATKVEIDSDYEFEVWFAKLMSPVIMPQARKKMVSDLDRLRAAVEK